MPRTGTRSKKKDFISCKRCRINSDTAGKDMLPCPRGGCEAMVTHILTITTVTTAVKLKKPIPIHY